MPYTSHYVDGGKGVLKIGSGVVDSADLLRIALQQAMDVEGTGLLKYALGDFSGVTEFHVSDESIRRLIEVQRKTAQRSRGAFVAIIAPEETTYGMSRLWQSFTDDIGWSACVFRNRPEAITWLREKLGDGNPDAPILDEFPTLKIEG